MMILKLQLPPVVPFLCYNGLLITVLQYPTRLKRAAMSGNIETMSWLVDEGHCEWDSHVLSKIPDNVDIMEWAKSRQYNWKNVPFLCAHAEAGNLEVIKWFFGKISPLRLGIFMLSPSLFRKSDLVSAFLCACKFGHLHIIEWTLQSIKIKFSSGNNWDILIQTLFTDGFNRAAGYAQKHVLEWIWNYTSNYLNFHPVILDASGIYLLRRQLISDNERQFLECIEWMATNRCLPCDTYDINVLRNITPEFLHWWLSNNDGAEWKDVTIAQLVKFGNMELLQVALHNGCSWGSLPLRRALRMKNYDLGMLRWMIEHGCPSNTLDFYAAQDISSLELLVELGVPMPSLCDIFLHEGCDAEYLNIFESFEILTWFENHGVSILNEILLCCLATFTVDEVKKYFKLFPEKNVHKVELLCAAICSPNVPLSNWLHRTCCSPEDLSNFSCCSAGRCFFDTLFEYGKCAPRLIDCHKYGLKICLEQQRYFIRLSLQYCNKKEDFEALEPYAKFCDRVCIDDYFCKMLFKNGRWRSVKWLSQHGYDWTTSAYESVVKYHHDPLFLQWIDQNFWKKI